VNNLNIHRIGDAISCGDVSANGSPNVFAGDGGAVCIPADVLQKETEKTNDYTTNPSKYQTPPGADEQIKRYYNPPPNTDDAIVIPPPQVTPPNVPTPSMTGDKFSFVGGNQSSSAGNNNNPTKGRVSLSYPAGWTQSRGGIVSVIRPPSSAAVLPLLQQYLQQASTGAWDETGMGGNPSNPKIINIWKDIRVGSTGMWTSDQTAWCAGFVQHVLKQSGLNWIPEAGARNTIARASMFGATQVPIAEMQPGDIVLWSYSHVNFVYSRFS